MSKNAKNIDRAISHWKCKCGNTQTATFNDIAESGIPFCSDCEKEMELNVVEIKEKK